MLGGQVRRRKHQVVSFVLKGKKIQSQQPSGRPHSHPRIRLPLGNQASHLQVGGGASLIAFHLLSFDAGRRQFLIQQQSRTGARFPVDQHHVLPGQVFHSPDTFLVAPFDHEALFPGRKGDHLHFRPFPVTSEVRQIGFARFGVHNMEAGDMHFSPLKSLDGCGAAHRPFDDRSQILPATEVFSGQKDGRIAAGYDNLPFHDPTVPQKPDLHPIAFAQGSTRRTSRSNEQPIGRDHKIQHLSQPRHWPDQQTLPYPRHLDAGVS